METVVVAVVAVVPEAGLTGPEIGSSIERLRTLKRSWATVGCCCCCCCIGIVVVVVVAGRWLGGGWLGLVLESDHGVYSDPWELSQKPLEAEAGRGTGEGVSGGVVKWSLREDHARGGGMTVQAAGEWLVARWPGGTLPHVMGLPPQLTLDLWRASGELRLLPRRGRTATGLQMLDACGCHVVGCPLGASPGMDRERQCLFFGGAGGAWWGRASHTAHVAMLR